MQLTGWSVSKELNSQTGNKKTVRAGESLEVRLKTSHSQQLCSGTEASWWRLFFCLRRGANMRKCSHSPWTHLHRCRTQSDELTRSHPKGPGMTPLSCPCLETRLGAVGEPGGLSTHTSPLLLSEEKAHTLPDWPGAYWGADWSWLIAGASIRLADPQTARWQHWHTLQASVRKWSRVELEPNHAWAKTLHAVKNVKSSRSPLLACELALLSVPLNLIEDTTKVWLLGRESFHFAHQFDLRSHDFESSQCRFDVTIWT